MGRLERHHLDPASLSAGDLTLDLLSRRVTRAGRELHLHAREFSLLEYLLRNRGGVVSKAMILGHVWDYSLDPKTNVVDVLVCRVRKKVERNFPAKLIRTVLGWATLSKELKVGRGETYRALQMDAAFPLRLRHPTRRAWATFQHDPRRRKAASARNARLEKPQARKNGVIFEYKSMRTCSFLILSLTLLATPLSAQTQDEDIQKKEADLKQEKLELQKKDLALQRRELELEKAKQELQYQENGQSLSMNLSGDVLFDYNKATLKPQAEDALKKVAVVLSQFPQSQVTVEGYTDSKGSKSFNQELSRDRATTVKNWLVEHGDVADANISAVGKGEENPVAENKHADGSDDPAGRAKNRRVSIIIAKPATTPTP